MIELLRRVAAVDPDRLAVVTDSVELSYADLVRRAQDLAVALTALSRAHSIGARAHSNAARAHSNAARAPGDAAGAEPDAADGLRFAVDSLDADVVVPALAAASLVGAEACVLPPDGPEVVHRLLERFEQSHVLRGAGALQSDALAGAASRGQERDSWRPVASGGAAWAVIGPSALSTQTTALSMQTTALSTQTTALSTGAGALSSRPHLVLTTGTTGEPRGVRHDWVRLLRATQRIDPPASNAEPGGDAERWLLAYGLHQFAGLQVLLHVFAAGATLVAPAPRRPREGLAAMRNHGVTHASATPTYWRFLLAELRSDGGTTPHLRQITLGGEAAPGPVLEQIKQAFPAAHLSHVYAASEFGATNSTNDGLPGLPAAVLDRDDDADVLMKVVDGELWVRSRIGMLGYHGEEPVDADGWRATGDLVEHVGDRLLFRGRVSEIINVGGVKVHPLPIEEAVAAVPGVQLSRVFGRPNAMTGAIVAVEVVPEPGADPTALKAAVRDACSDLPAAARPRSVKVVDEVHTAGGKIVRRDTA